MTRQCDWCGCAVKKPCKDEIAASDCEHYDAFEPPVMCQACEEGRCWDCGMQTWCECDCAGPDGCYIFDPSEDLIRSTQINNPHAFDPKKGSS